MPGVVLPFRTPPAPPLRRAAWSLLEVARPGHSVEPLGILLVDEETGNLSLQLRDGAGFDDLEEEDSDYLGALAADLERKGAERDGRALLASLEDSLSGFLRISGRTAIEYSGDAERTVLSLFDEHVDGEVRPFVTHLPVYGLRAAATRFGEEFDPSQLQDPESWVRVPGGLRLREGMFVSQVVGRSMEPLIRDGSYCVFRAPVTGSRQGRHLLIEQLSETNLESRYTVKRYTSTKSEDGEGGWRHDTIRLEPLNRQFDAFELEPGQLRVIAEFVRVL